MTANDMLSVQAELEQSNAGFRRLPGTTLKDGLGRIVYTPPQDHSEIVELMSDLERFLLTQSDRTYVLDTKWKRIDQSLSNASDKYGLSQPDFYQLFAYGERYLDGVGEMLLVYPMTRTFSAPLPVFVYSESLTLRVVPFDLERGQLVGHELHGWS